MPKAFKAKRVLASRVTLARALAGLGGSARTFFHFDTDHKPLLGLLDGQKPTSPLESVVTVVTLPVNIMFEYELKFRNTTAHANADALPESTPLTC